MVDRYLDALEDRVANNDDCVSFGFEDLVCDAAEAVEVVEVAGGVVSPTRAAVDSAFDANRAYLSEQFFELRVIEFKGHEIEITHGLPVLAKILVLEILEFTGFFYEPEPKELGPGIPNVVIIVEIRRRGDD